MKKRTERNWRRQRDEYLKRKKNNRERDSKGKVYENRGKTVLIKITWKCGSTITLPVI